MGTAGVPNRYCRCASRVLLGLSQALRVSLTGTAHPHRYCGCASLVLHNVTGTSGVPHGYRTTSRVLHTRTGTTHILYRTIQKALILTFEVDGPYCVRSIRLERQNKYYPVWTLRSVIKSILIKRVEDIYVKGFVIGALPKQNMNIQ